MKLRIAIVEPDLACARQVIESLAPLAHDITVRLKSGDPGIFGRATEELEAARAAGIAVEVVPGITTANAACASLGTTLALYMGCARSRGSPPLCAAPGCRSTWRSPSSRPPPPPQNAAR